MVIRSMESWASTRMHDNYAIKRYFCALIAIVLNSIGHSLTIVTNMGSILWPASVVNIMHMMKWSMLQTIFREGIVVSILTTLIERQFRWHQWREELLFLVPYSIFMQLFADLWRLFGVPHLLVWGRLGLDLFGLVVAFAGLALYSECAVAFHPNDVLSKSLRRHLNLTFMRNFNLFLPLIIISLCFLKNHQLFAFQIGTLVGLLFKQRVTEFWQMTIEKYLHL